MSSLHFHLERSWTLLILVLMLIVDLWAVNEVIIIYHPYMSLDSSKCNISTIAMRALHCTVFNHHHCLFEKKLSSHEIYDQGLHRG